MEYSKLLCFCSETFESREKAKIFVLFYFILFNINNLSSLHFAFTINTFNFLPVKMCFILW